MNCFEKVTVNAQAINWLKEKYPELCIKAGLCERIGGRLYTKTFIDPPAAQPAQRKPLTDEQIEALWSAVPGQAIYLAIKVFARTVEAAHGIKEGT